MALLAIGVLALNGAGRVGADPLKNPNAFAFDFVCEDGLTFSLVTPSGPAAVAHAVGATDVLVASAVTAVVTDLTTGQILDTITQTFGEGRRSGLQEELITCVATETVIDPASGQTIQFRLTVETIITPRGH
jgi:hypothetical protein